MRPLLIACSLLTLLLVHLLVTGSVDAAKPDGSGLKSLLPGEPTSADLERAKEVLKSWAQAAPKDPAADVPRLMRIVYWSPADREPQPEFRPRLTRVMQHIQAFYAREMESWGFPGRSIQLELAEDGLLNIYPVQGQLKSAECSEADGKDGQAIRRDALQALRKAGLNGNQETMVIFCNLADWDPAQRTMSHHSPYYASGDHQGGTAWQVDSPLLDAASLAVKDQFLQDRQYGKISLGKYNSIFVGGVCHELGHALGLPHCKECPAARAARGTALMGSGNRTYGDELRGEGRGSFLSLPHALKLAAHPQFSKSMKANEIKAEATFSAWKLSPIAAGLQVEAVVTTNLPVHAVLAYADPAGGGDYDSEIAAAVPQADGKFSLLLPLPEKKDARASLHFVAVCANGAATASVWSAQAFTLPAKINAASGYEVSATMVKLELDQHLAAFRAGKLTDADLAKLSAPLPEIFRRLKAPDTAKDKPTPASTPADTKRLALSDAAPLKAQTGWGGVHYDRTNEGQPLIGPEGVLAHGLYAHADSLYEYDLGGNWQSFTGLACLLQDAQGSVLATVTGDDKPLWKSSVLKPGESKDFKLDVKGVQKLRLEISGVKGNNGAWGAWGQPLLER